MNSYVGFASRWLRMRSRTSRPFTSPLHSRSIDHTYVVDRTERRIERSGLVRLAKQQSARYGKSVIFKFRNSWSDTGWLNVLDPARQCSTRQRGKAPSKTTAFTVGSTDQSAESSPADWSGYFESGRGSMAAAPASAAQHERRNIGDLFCAGKRRSNGKERQSANIPAIFPQRLSPCCST